MKLLAKLKKLNPDILTPQFALVQFYNRGTERHYIVKYIEISQKLGARLKSILTSEIGKAKSVEEYSYDCPEIEDGLARTIDANETDYKRILEVLKTRDPHTDKVSDRGELSKVKAYMLILRQLDKIVLVAYRNVPETWKLKSDKGLFSILYTGKRFEDLQEQDIFSISNRYDFVVYDEQILILSKKGFEHALNFREGLKAKAQAFYETSSAIGLFKNIEVLSKNVGDNMHLMRKIATIENMGLYKDKQFIRKIKDVNSKRNWGLEFLGDEIVITDDNVNSVLYILSNRRLTSELTEETFDVESAKPI